jgi:hypothetical protein
MRHHELKIDPHILGLIARGEKTCEIRYNDRDFQPGDTILLRETVHEGSDMHVRKLPLQYTGKELRVRVSHVLRCPDYDVPLGYALLSIHPEEEASLSSISAAFCEECSHTLDPDNMDALDRIFIALLRRDDLCMGHLPGWMQRRIEIERKAFHSPGARAIYAERQRQVKEEGFDAAHDACVEPGDLNLLAAYYCLHGQREFLERELFPSRWDKKWAKREGFPFPSRRDLEKAGSLIAAALDRMGRED